MANFQNQIPPIQTTSSTNKFRLSLPLSCGGRLLVQGYRASEQQVQTDFHQIGHRGFKPSLFVLCVQVPPGWPTGSFQEWRPVSRAWHRACDVPSLGGAWPSNRHQKLPRSAAVLEQYSRHDTARRIINSSARRTWLAVWSFCQRANQSEHFFRERSGARLLSNLCRTWDACGSRP